jgi:hypothetical protein
VGPETLQSLTFALSCLPSGTLLISDETTLFPNGTLRLVTAPGTFGGAECTVSLRDDGVSVFFFCITLEPCVE